MRTTQGIEAVVRQVVHGLLPDAELRWGDYEVAVTADGELVCMAYFNDDMTPRDVVLHVANLVHDMAIEILGRAIPECPGHTHPAVLRAAGDGVAWVCPGDGRVLATYAV